MHCLRGDYDHNVSLGATFIDIVYVCLYKIFRCIVPRKVYILIYINK